MTISRLEWHESPPDVCRGAALSIGNFDGVHLGHASLISELRRQADQRHCPAVAVTFDPHPLQILRPAQFLPPLTAPLDRARLLKECGADSVLLLQATSELLQLSASEFFRQFVIERLQAKILVEGPNFGFGRNREANIETLAALCGQHGLDLVVVSAVEAAGRPVSSSLVRQALMSGNVKQAAAYLRRPYALRGTVVPGMQRGRVLGFPTANLADCASLVPGDGVYAVFARHEATVWPGAANVGCNPTFGDSERKVEVHLIGFQGDLLGQELRIEFLDRLRDTQAFPGRVELVDQLKRDIEAARRVCQQYPLEGVGHGR